MQFRFENHLLDADRRELRRGPDLVEVEPQVFDLLLYLIQQRDRVVSKEDLIASVWGGRIVSDSTLTSRINAARKAVGDNGEEQRLIRTIARKGIRFVCTVDEPAKPNEGSHPAGSATTRSPQHEITSARRPMASASLRRCRPKARRWSRHPTGSTTSGRLAADLGHVHACRQAPADPL